MEPTCQTGALPTSTSPLSTLSFLFDSDEHKIIGDHVSLKIPEIKKRIKVSNELFLSYGELILLGDFYGSPKDPICKGSDLDERVKRFENAFEILKHSKKKEVDGILEIVKSQEKNKAETIKQGIESHCACEKIGIYDHIKWAYVTNSIEYPLGRYVELTLNNFDHFGKNARLAYIAGHKAALNKAVEAFNKKMCKTKEDAIEADELLHEALGMNAFADHFLTDLFASGHLRTPRSELHDNVFFSKISGALSLLMHNEDNINGLVVTNKNGDKWKAFGDGYLLDSTNRDNLEFAVKATTDSCQEIVDVFTSGKLPPNDDYLALKMIPILENFENDETNHQPLFKFNKEGEILCRRRVEDLNCKDYVSSWNGVWTIIKMNYLNPNKPNSHITKPDIAPIVLHSSQGPLSESKVRFSFSYKEDINESEFGKWTEYIQLKIGFTQIKLCLPKKDSLERVLYCQIGEKIYEPVSTIPNDKDTVSLHMVGEIICLMKD